MRGRDENTTHEEQTQLPPTPRDLPTTGMIPEIRMSRSRVDGERETLKRDLRRVRSGAATDKGGVGGGSVVRVRVTGHRLLVSLSRLKGNERRAGEAKREAGAKRECELYSSSFRQSRESGSRPELSRLCGCCRNRRVKATKLVLLFLRLFPVSHACERRRAQQ